MLKLKQNLNYIVSYAQNYEDVMLWRALRHIGSGFYIDVGAYSPDLDSVTRLFYDRGWRGINIEPQPYFLARLKEKRPHDINLGLAISDHIGEAEFHDIERTGLSTLAAEIARRAEGKGHHSKVSRVGVTTLADIWDRHVPQGQPVHFLKIDVEGFEEHVIRGADWKRHRPWIVIAESTVPDGTEQNFEAWEPLLLAAGYDFVWFDGLNRFYVAREHAELANAFKAPPNVFDRFRRAAEVALETRAEAAEARLKEGQPDLASLGAEIARLRETILADRGQRAGIEAHLADLRADVAGLKAETQTIRHALTAGTTHDGDRQRQPVHGEQSARPPWLRLLFGRPGKPGRPLRRMLPDRGGAPRGMFRNWIFRAKGSPRDSSAPWIPGRNNETVRGMGKQGAPPDIDHAHAAAPGADPKAAGAAPALSPEAEPVARRISALRSISPSQV